MSETGERSKMVRRSLSLLLQMVGAVVSAAAEFWESRAWLFISGGRSFGVCVRAAVTVTEGAVVLLA